MSNIHRLTPIQVKKTSRLGFIADGGGLYLRVRSKGTKTWVFRYHQNKKPRDITLGPVHTINMTEARALACSMRLAALEGRDPRTVLQRDVGVPTFKDAAVAIIERRSKIWKSDKTDFRWQRGLMLHAKSLHDRPVTQITSKDVESVILPIWYSQNHSARMTRGMIEQALDLATVLGWRTGDNPARWKGALEYLLPDYNPKVQHHAAMPYRDVSVFFTSLGWSNHPTRNALAFVILTASRGHMVRDAVWSEFDIKNKLWEIPAERMKRSAEDHLVPLTDAMISVLPAPGEGLVFPFRNKAFSENAFRSTLKAMDVPYTAHGFRSTFKDWAAECTTYSDEVSELALAHKVGSSVRRAYRRGSSIELRRTMMAEWGNFLYDATGKA